MDAARPGGGSVFVGRESFEVGFVLFGSVAPGLVVETGTRSLVHVFSCLTTGGKVKHHQPDRQSPEDSKSNVQPLGCPLVFLVSLSNESRYARFGRSCWLGAFKTIRSKAVHVGIQRRGDWCYFMNHFSW